MKKKRYQSKILRVCYAFIKLAFDIISIPFKILIGILDVIEEIKK